MRCALVSQKGQNEPLPPAPGMTWPVYQPIEVRFQPT